MPRKLTPERAKAIRAALKLHRFRRTTYMSIDDIKAMGFKTHDVDAAYLFEKMGEILAQAFCDGINRHDVDNHQHQHST